jgi:hypothetical protein
MKKIIKLFKFVLMFCIIYASGTAYSSSSKSDISVLICLLTVILILLSYKKVNRIQKTVFLAFILLTILYFLTMAINGDLYWNYYFGIIFSLFNAILICCVYNPEEFNNIFLIIVGILCVISIPLFIIGMIVPSFVTSLPIYEMTSTHQLFRNFYYVYFYRGSYWVETTKSSGMFREPGVYGGILIFAIFLLKNSKITHKKLLLILYVLALITTYSTVGILSLIVLIIVEYLSDSSVTHKKVINRLLEGSGILTIVISYIYKNYSELFDKLDKSSSSYFSFSDRLYGTVCDFKIMINDIFFGVGITKYLSLANLYNSNSSNSFTTMAAVAGIFTPIILFYGFFLFINKHFKIKNRRVFIYLVFISQFVMQGLISFQLIHCFIMWGYFQNKNQKLNSTSLKTNAF